MFSFYIFSFRLKFLKNISRVKKNVKKRLNWTRENEIIAQLANFHAAMWPALWRTKEVRDLDIPLSFSLNFFFFFCKSGWLASSPEKNYNNYPACVFTREAFTGFFQLLHHHLFFLFIKTLERISSPERPEMVKTLSFFPAFGLRRTNELETDVSCL
jgi:hypothetical protein